MKPLIKFFIPALLFTFIACSGSKAIDEVVIPEEDISYIKISESKVDFTRLISSQILTVETNVEDITCSVSSTGNWCSAIYNNGTLTISATSNDAARSRVGLVELKGDNIRKAVTITQAGRSSSTGEIKDDIKIAVKSATASSFQNGEDIARSYDGNYSTLYHSNYNTSASAFPISLTYNFTNVEIMDYMIYNPRTDGSNGNFKEFDVYVATAENPVLTLFGSYDNKGLGSASIITFSPALKNPTTIEFRVKSGVGNFASCAEMQFFKKNPDNFDFSTLFTDMTCSQLKSGITETDIENVTNQFYKELALEIFNGNYDMEFRVQDYKAWQHPDVMAAINKSRPYSLRDNPTGIYVRAGDDLIAMVGDMHGQSISLFVQDPTKMISGSPYPLREGINKFKVSNDGLIYVMYHTQTGTEDPVKIHIATGSVNGYFDIKKHTKEDWVKLLEKATFERFDLVGEYAHLAFETNMYRQYTPDGVELINLYDDMVKKEQEFAGLFKYDKAYKNRMFCLVMNGSSFMHASNYYTGYDASTQNTVLNASTLKRDPWGPAHEIGHMNQVAPGFKWQGMTEVSNNVQSLNIQTLWGNTSRLITDNVYSKAFTQIIAAKIPHSTNTDMFCKVVPFWQLKLYMHDALGKTDFYKDVYEKIRVNPNPPTDGDCQLEFVKIACDVAQLDLTEFFEAWGLLMPVNVNIDDYGNALFSITAEKVVACKAYIASKNYPKPVHKIQDITDANIANFK